MNKKEHFNKKNVIFFILIPLILFLSILINKNINRNIDNNIDNNNYEIIIVDGGTVLNAISYNSILSNENTIKLTDKNNNIIYIPKGFKVLKENNATTVDKGIVIEDVNGNQFVWVPVGTVNLDDNQRIEIILGRYEDFTINGNGPKPIQEASEEKYGEQVVINNKFFECNSEEYINAKAKDLKEYISSSLKYGGYYIGRYECGIIDTDKTTTEVYIEKNRETWSKDDLKNFYSKKISIGIQPNIGVWNYISQNNASVVSQKIYNNGVKTDLINSYAWDTALIFIEKCGNKINSKDYAYYELDDYNNILDVTGTYREELNDYDIQCNIFDLSTNAKEMTTETSNHFAYEGLPWATKYHFVSRGSDACIIDSNGNTHHPYNPYSVETQGPAYRSYDTYEAGVGFRVILYI